MNIFHITNIRRHSEEPEQVDSENKDMEESIRTMVNMFNYMCVIRKQVFFFDKNKIVSKMVEIL